MPKGRAKTTDYVIGIVLFVLISMVIGVGSNASGIAIYGDLPTIYGYPPTRPFYPYTAYTITVKNNSPTINPVIVPLYFVWIEPNNVSCTIFSAESPDCNRMWDVKIDSGGEASFRLMLSPHAQNFTISVFVYLNLWNVGRIPSGSRIFYFEYLANGTYLMRGWA
jgi:hypothetical protein